MRSSMQGGGSKLGAELQLWKVSCHPLLDEKTIIILRIFLAVCIAVGSDLVFVVSLFSIFSLVFFRFFSFCCVLVLPSFFLSRSLVIFYLLSFFVFLFFFCFFFSFSFSLSSSSLLLSSLLYLLSFRLVTCLFSLLSFHSILSLLLQGFSFVSFFFFRLPSILLFLVALSLLRLFSSFFSSI